MPHYTALAGTDGINPVELNQRFEELSEAINDMLAGNLTQTQPDIDDFTNATHDHEDAAGGGQLTVDAIDSTGATDGQVAAADGLGGVSWSDVVTAFIGLTDTISSYSGRALQILRINAAADGVEGVGLAKDDYVFDEVTNYQTTSTSFVDVDATNLSFTLTAEGSGVVVAFGGTCRNVTAGALINFDLDVDGSRVAGDDGIITIQFASGAGNLPVTFVRYIPLTAGSHTIKLQWKVSAGTGVIWSGDGTSLLDVHPQKMLMEVA